MTHVPPSYLEQGGVGEEEDEEEEGLSLWSCIKNRLRRKKCTCHLNNIGKNHHELSLYMIHYGLLFDKLF